MAIPITYLSVQTPTGIIDVPIYNIADVSNSSYRIMTNSGVGCFDLVADSVNLPIKVMTSGGLLAVNIQETPAYNGKARYVRDWLMGSNVNTNNHWMEIMVINDVDTNVALGKSVIASDIIYDSNLITDGITNVPNGYSQLNESQPTNPHYVQIDLGSIQTLKEIRLWHYYPDSRTYNGTKTEVSEDGVVWYTLYDSAISGTYVETSSGKIISATKN